MDKHEKKARAAGWIAEEEYNGEDDGVRHPLRGDWTETWASACKQEALIDPIKRRKSTNEQALWNEGGRHSHRRDGAYG